MSDSGHAIPLARLHEHISARGDRYFTGRLGLARVIIVKSDEKCEDAYAIWDVLVQEVPASELDSPKADRPGWRRPAVPDYLLPDPL